MLTFSIQLYLTNSFGNCCCSYSKVLWKTIENNPFIKNFGKTLNDFITAVFVVFKCGTLTSSFFVEFASNLHILIFSLSLCVGLQISNFGLYLLSNMAVENNGTPLKSKFDRIEKQNIDFGWFGSANDEYDRIEVVRYFICR